MFTLPAVATSARAASRSACASLIISTNVAGSTPAAVAA
jgi:hypothetical protein